MRTATIRGNPKIICFREFSCPMRLVAFFPSNDRNRNADSYPPPFPGTPPRSYLNIMSISAEHHLRRPCASPSPDNLFGETRPQKNHLRRNDRNATAPEQRAAWRNLVPGFLNRRTGNPLSRRWKPWRRTRTVSLRHTSCSRMARRQESVWIRSTDIVHGPCCDSMRTT